MSTVSQSGGSEIPLHGNTDGVVDADMPVVEVKSWHTLHFTGHSALANPLAHSIATHSVGSNVSPQYAGSYSGATEPGIVVLLVLVPPSGPTTISSGFAHMHGHADA